MAKPIAKKAKKKTKRLCFYPDKFKPDEVEINIEIIAHKDKKKNTMSLNGREVISGTIIDNLTFPSIAVGDTFKNMSDWIIDRLEHDYFGLNNKKEVN